MKSIPNIHLTYDDLTGIRFDVHRIKCLEYIFHVKNSSTGYDLTFEKYAFILFICLF